MKPKGLLIAVVLLAVLAGVIFWSNKSKSAETTGKLDKPLTTKLISIPTADVEELRIKKLAGEVQDIKLVDGKWRIVAPKDLAADTDAMTTMVSNLSTL